MANVLPTEEISGGWKAWLVGQGVTDWSQTALGGGSTCLTSILSAGGQRWVLKARPDAPEDFFLCEARGLELLASASGGPPVPVPLAWGREWLVEEWLEPGSWNSARWEAFGRALARLHSTHSPRFGLEYDNWIGLGRQNNGRHESAAAFFGNERLLPQARRAREAGLLGTADLNAVESLVQRLPSLLPETDPSLVHGDLWSGNLHPLASGGVALIDPAAHYGIAEADLAMTDLFGRLPDAVFSAYQEVRPLAPGWRERFELYNLYHLLNHLNLFGRGYQGEVRQVLLRWS